MTQEEKELLLKDLCARLSYGVKCCYDILSGEIKIDTLICTNRVIIGHGFYWDTYFENCNEDIPLEAVRPYLRPMSSMTEEEYNELKKISSYYGLAPFEDIHNWTPDYNLIDWLNRKMFDYRDLIPKGLALEAPEGMYNN